jgi:hypothetical protein
MKQVLWMSNQAPRCSETAKDLQGDFPGEESLGDTLVRVLPCWEGAIAPELQARRRTGVDAFDSVEAFDPATETFVPVGTLAEARMKHTATQLSDPCFDHRPAPLPRL